MARRNSLFRHILVTHDFSKQATVALTTAGRLAKAHGGKLRACGPACHRPRVDAPGPHQEASAAQEVNRGRVMSNGLIRSGTRRGGRADKSPAVVR